jgi:hypothetical protein
MFDVSHINITFNPQLSGDVSLASFCPEGFVGIGVPIGTDTFVQNLVDKTCRDTNRCYIGDIEKLETIQDDFIHHQLLRFCQTTRLQNYNSNILLRNRCVLKQQYFDYKIADTLLKRGTKEHTDDWDTHSKDWGHMILHLPHAEGGFGVTFNDITEDTSFYTSTSRYVSWTGPLTPRTSGLVVAQG